MLGDRLESIASKKIAIVLVLVLCLGLRLGLALYKGDAEVADNDARAYIEIAQNLADGKGFSLGRSEYYAAEAHPTAYGDPVYPAFLAVIFMTLGDGLMNISVVQAILDTITCFLVFRIACVFVSRRLAAVLAALLYAVYMPFVLTTCTAMTETVGLFLTTLSFYLLALAFRRGLWFFALAGAAMGLTILLKPAMLGFPFAVAVMLFAARRRTPGWLSRIALYCAAAYLAVSPWTIRNYIVLDAFVPVATHGGSTLWGGTGPADGVTLGGWSYPVDSKERNLTEHPRVPDVSEKTYLKITKFQERLAKMGEVERDAALKRAALKEIREHPGRYAFLGVKKVFRLWFNLWHDFPASTATKALAAGNAVILALAFLGYRRRKIDENYRLVTLCVCGYLTLVSIATYAVVRYSYPGMVMLFVIAAGQAVSWLSGHSRTKPADVERASV